MFKYDAKHEKECFIWIYYTEKRSVAHFVYSTCPPSLFFFKISLRTLTLALATATIYGMHLADGQMTSGDHILKVSSTSEKSDCYEVEKFELMSSL